MANTGVLIGGPDPNRAPLYAVTVFADHYEGGVHVFTDATFWQITAGGAILSISFEGDKLMVIPMARINEFFIETMKETVEVPDGYR